MHMMAYYATTVKDVLNNLKNKMLENVEKLTRTIGLAIRLSNDKLTGAKGCRECNDRNPFASEFSAGL